MLKVAECGNVYCQNFHLIDKIFLKYPKGFVLHDSGKAKSRKGH